MGRGPLRVEKGKAVNNGRESFRKSTTNGARREFEQEFGTLLPALGLNKITHVAGVHYDRGLAVCHSVAYALIRTLTKAAIHGGVPTVVIKKLCDLVSDDGNRKKLKVSMKAFADAMSVNASIGCKVSAGNRLIRELNNALPNLRLGGQRLNAVIGEDFDPTLEYDAALQQYRITAIDKARFEFLATNYRAVLVLTETNHNLATSKPVINDPDPGLRLGSARPRAYTPDTQWLVNNFGATTTQPSLLKNWERKGRQRANSL